MAKKVEAYRIEIPISTTDEYSAEIKRAEKAIDGLNKSVDKESKATAKATKEKKGFADATRNVEKTADSASRSIGNIGKSASDAEKKVGRARRTFETFGKNIKSLSSKAHDIKIGIKDNATRGLRAIQSRWDGFKRNPVVRLTVWTVDRSLATLRMIKNMIFSIPTMITVGLSVVGIKNLSQATLESAMNWEKYEVSMNHWLGGNIKQAKELTKWMGEFADITPFSSPELFPALTSALSITNRDIAKSKQYLKVASDMAALTPGRTPEEAMQAIKNAKMGETTMLKGFGINYGVEDIAKMGGFDKLMDEIEKVFDGGAEQLSKTASGILATLKGYRGSFMRSIGTGFLEPMKPRLDAINVWLENNQETWARWKGMAVDSGREVSEALFTNLEKAFFGIRDRYLNNPEFQSLSIGGKFKMISGDIKSYLNSNVKPAISEWWDESGSDMAVDFGKLIGMGIVEGIKVGFKAGGNLFTSAWGDVAKDFKETGFSGDTGKSLAGAGAITGGIAYLAKKIIYDPMKSVFDVGKRVVGKTKKTDSKKTTTRKYQPLVEPNRKTTSYSDTMMQRKGANALPDVKKTPKINWGKLGKGLKKVPYLGALLTGISMVGGSSSIGEGVGGIGGTVAGAATGAAIGSVVPGVGTAIGGTVGGLLGGFGGGVAGDWIQENWGTFAESFNLSVWEPMKAFSTDAVDFVKGGWMIGKEKVLEYWVPLKSAFAVLVWDPLVEGFNNTMDGIGEAFTIGREVVSILWSPVSEWFGMNVWTPLSAGFTVLQEDIGEKFDIAKATVSASWSPVSEWFGTNVWAPLMAGVDTVSSYLGEKLDGMKLAAGAASTVIGRKVSEGYTLGKTTLGAATNAIINKGRGNKSSQSGGGGGLTPHKAYARGGIATSPHIGLVAEAGVPESMIPHDGSQRSKNLWVQTGEALGLIGNKESAPSTAINANGASNGINIEIPINITTGGNFEEIYNKITAQLYTDLKLAFENSGEGGN